MSRTTSASSTWSPRRSRRPTRSPTTWRSQADEEAEPSGTGPRAIERSGCSSCSAARSRSRCSWSVEPRRVVGCVLRLVPRVDQAVQSSDRSVTTCRACRATGFSGVLGALRYIPTLARETIDEFTALDVAHGVLDPRACVSCHEDLSATPDLAAAHQGGDDCASCHGDVAHPPLRLAGFDRPVDELAEGQVHPRLYVQTHGSDVALDPESCTECHETDFCETCHLRETFPHPNDWIETHGPTQIELGPETCQGCHAPTFCEGCHGTEVPHNVRWLGEHWRELRTPARARVCSATRVATAPTATRSTGPPRTGSLRMSEPERPMATPQAPPQQGTRRAAVGHRRGPARGGRTRRRRVRLAVGGQAARSRPRRRRVGPGGAPRARRESAPEARRRRSAGSTPGSLRSGVGRRSRRPSPNSPRASTATRTTPPPGGSACT
jgi:hypothetical protein